MLALHGWGRSHRDFDPVFAATAPVLTGETAMPAGSPGSGAVPSATGVGARLVTGAVSVIGPDLFGFGSTPPPPEPWGSDDYARHLLPLFEEEGVLAERVVIVGHSFGGRVAVRLQRLVPDRIERMVLCGVPLLDRSDRRSHPPTAYRLVRRLNALGLIGADRMEAARNRYGSPDYRAAEGVMRGVLVASMGEQYAEDMAAIDCPVQLVWGEKDAEVPLEVAVRAQGMFPRASLTVLPRVGHLVPTEAPDQFLAAILGGDDDARAGSR
jgi:pimeloyl-ACP methyl ester carboxylesterase